MMQYQKHREREKSTSKPTQEETAQLPERHFTAGPRRSQKVDGETDEGSRATCSQIWLRSCWDCAVFPKQSIMSNITNRLRIRVSCCVSSLTCFVLEVCFMPRSAREGCPTIVIVTACYSLAACIVHEKRKHSNSLSVLGIQIQHELGHFFAHPTDQSPSRIAVHPADSNLFAYHAKTSRFGQPLFPTQLPGHS